MHMKEFSIMFTKKRGFHFSSAIVEGNVIKLQNYRIERLTEMSC